MGAYRVLVVLVLCVLFSGPTKAQRVLHVGEVALGVAAIICDTLSDAKKALEAESKGQTDTFMKRTDHTCDQMDVAQFVVHGLVAPPISLDEGQKIISAFGISPVRRLKSKVPQNYAVRSVIVIGSR